MSVEPSRHELGQGYVMVRAGVAFGDASPREPENLQKVASLAKELGFAEVVLLQVAMTDHICDPQQTTPSVYGLCKSDGVADGLLIEQVGRATLIANADCPVGCLLAPDARAVVMHLGLECIWSPARKSGILAAGVEALGVAAKHCRLVFGAGAGPCCFGYGESSPKHHVYAEPLRARYGEEVFPGAIRKGPRRGQIAYDLGQMIRAEARLQGIGEVEQIGGCSSCAGLDEENKEGMGRYFSHLRDREGVRGRNMVLVGRLVEEVSADGEE